MSNEKEIEPFCVCGNKYFFVFVEKLGTDKKFAVQCHSCGIIGPFSRDRIGAISKWNKTNPALRPISKLKMEDF